mmetsp:Transcript_29076/g.86062  ORF Transcript_29076/g.86062 Transcript_29076/m.86062 type:complete len:81 (+) Transcript_29076:1956-2198(+)
MLPLVDAEVKPFEVGARVVVSPARNRDRRNAVCILFPCPDHDHPLRPRRALLEEIRRLNMIGHTVQLVYWCDLAGESVGF